MVPFYCHCNNFKCQDYLFQCLAFVFAFLKLDIPSTVTLLSTAISNFLTQIKLLTLEIKLNCLLKFHPVTYSAYQ